MTTLGDFNKMMILNEVSFKLGQISSKYYEKIRREVEIYLSKHHPDARLTENTRNFSIKFYSAGVVVTWETLDAKWGGLDEEADVNYSMHRLDLAYGDIFGWEPKNKTGDEMFEYVDLVIDGFKKNPKFTNYEI